MILFQHIPIWGWWFGTWFVWLSIYWEFHHPNWGTHIFQRGRAQPPSSMIPTIVGGSDPTMPNRVLNCCCVAMQKWFSVENLIEPTLDSRLNSENHCLQWIFLQKNHPVVQVSDPHDATFSHKIAFPHFFPWFVSIFFIILSLAVDTLTRGDQSYEAVTFPRARRLDYSPRFPVHSSGHQLGPVVRPD